MSGDRVIGHTKGPFIVKNAKFTVRSAGNRRAKKENKKNVHAFIVGDVLPIDQCYNWLINGALEQVKYNYATCNQFIITSSNKEIFEAKYVLFDKSLRAFVVSTSTINQEA